MSKLDWHHVIHIFHFLGVALVLSQPVTTLMVWATAKEKSLGVSAKFAELLGRVDRVAQVGLGILIISGIGQIWAHDIGPGDIFGNQVWLGIKLILVALLVLNGSLLAGPAVRRRIGLLHQLLEAGGEPSPEQHLALRANYMRTQLTGSAMVLLLTAILLTVIFQPFTANPR